MDHESRGTEGTADSAPPADADSAPSAGAARATGPADPSEATDDTMEATSAGPSNPSSGTPARHHYLDVTLPSGGGRSAIEPTHQARTRAESRPPAPAGGEPAPLQLVARSSYTTEREIARGGMGRVVSAIDNRHGRPVALKELIEVTASHRARFEREAFITARLQHPGIVPIYEAGNWPDGSPFYAMRRVDGTPLDKLVAERKTLAERLAMLPDLIAVADAIAYAHSQRIIHRDLKPANVLCGPFGETVVIDWGLAKHLGEPLTVADTVEPEADTLAVERSVDQQLTRAGTVFGTPAYMPPEQARGRPVDQRADVYSLGAMLYFVLTGSPPFSGSKSASILAQVADTPPPPIEELEPAVPRDLAAIVAKAMARDAAERYPTAAELVDDLKRFETGQLVSVRDYGAAELVWRWVRRHRAPIAIATAALVILAVVGAVAVSRVVAARDRARHQESLARHEESLARDRASRITLLQARSALDTDPTAALAWLERVTLDPDNLAAARDIAQRALDRGVARAVLPGPRAPTMWRAPLALSGDGRWLARGSESSVLLFDTDTLTRRELTHDAEVRALAFSPDGRQLATTSGLSVRLWDLETGRAKVLGDHPGGAVLIAFSHDGKWLASTGRQPGLSLWNPATGERRRLDGGPIKIFTLAFSPDDRYVATGGWDGTVGLVDVGSGERHPLGKQPEICYALAFSPDGEWLASSGMDDTIMLWSRSGRKPRRLRGHKGAILDVSFSTDGQRLASGGADGTVRLWDVASASSRILAHHSGFVRTVTFAPGGDRVVSAGADLSVRITALDGEQWLLRGHRQVVFGFATAADWLATFDFGGDVRLWRWPARRRRPLTHHPTEVRQLLVSADGTRVASADTAGSIHVTDLATGAVRVVTEDMAYLDLGFLPDNQRLIGGARDHTIRIWNLATGASEVVGRPEISLIDLVLAPDGSRVAARTPDELLTTWSLDDRSAPPRTDQDVSFAAFSSTGATALGHPDGTVTVDTPGQPARTLDYHRARLVHLTYSSDGRYLGSCDAEGAAWLWDSSTDHATRLSGPCAPWSAPTVSPAGSWVLVARQDGTAALTGLRGQQTRLLPAELGASCEYCFDFSSDERYLVTCGQERAARVWDLQRGSVRVHGSDHALLDCRLTGDNEMVTGDVAGAVTLWVAPFVDPVPERAAELASWLASTSPMPPALGLPTPEH